MGHSKQNKGQKKDGQHRAETREERQERLRKQEESRQVSTPYLCDAMCPIYTACVERQESINK